MSKITDLTAVRRVHFIGVGGIGMSALARLFLSEGKGVSGSDRTSSVITDALVTEGVTFYPTQIAENIYTHSLPDLVVYTEAMPHDHPELREARARSIPTLSYFEALGCIANQYRVVAVSGSHGKTTTTAMLIDIFEHAGLDPNAVVGSLRARTRSNYRKGKGSYFIVEACEYRRDFLSLVPEVLVITNIELEHVDYYRTLTDVQDAFCELVAQMQDGGVVVLQRADPAVQPVIGVAEAKGIRVVDYRNFLNPTVSLPVPGLHNRLNAAAAAAAADVCGVSATQTNEALSQFAGTWRRFEYKGEVNGAKIYDDYGHHPTEILATVRGARELYPDRKLTLIFQAHTYTRTQTLFQDFVSALAQADRVCLLPIYAAREENTTGISHESLKEALLEKQIDARSFSTFESVVTEIKPTLSKNDVVLVMGAGDVTQVASELTKTNS